MSDMDHDAAPTWKVLALARVAETIRDCLLHASHSEEGLEEIGVHLDRLLRDPVIQNSQNRAMPTTSAGLDLLIATAGLDLLIAASHAQQRGTEAVLWARAQADTSQSGGGRQ